METMTISQFKAHLSEALRRVRNGGHLVILDRETPVARVVPYQEDALIMRQPKEQGGLPAPSSVQGSQALKFLVEDRERR